MRLKDFIKKLPLIRDVVCKFKLYDKQLQQIGKRFLDLKNENRDIKQQLEKQILDLKNENRDIKQQLEKRFLDLKNENRNIKRQIFYEQCKKLPLYLQKNWLKDVYAERLQKTLDLDHPKNYSEKIQWMKLYWNPDIKARLTDKYLVREFVKERVGEKYLLKNLGVWDCFSDIDFKKLPNQFVLKMNHGYAMNLIVTDKTKMNLKSAQQKFREWMLDDFSFHTMEMHYTKIRRKIIAEEYIENFDGDVYDYKLWCFKGKVHYIQFIIGRKTDLQMAFFDPAWNLMPFVDNHPRYTQNIPKPDNLDEMIDVAEKLARGFEHVRVDLYRLNDGSIKFGEMTFTPASGFCRWDPPEWDEKIGSLLDLSALSSEKEFSAENVDSAEVSN